MANIRFKSKPKVSTLESTAGFPVQQNAGDNFIEYQDLFNNIDVGLSIKSGDFNVPAPTFKIRGLTTTQPLEVFLSPFDADGTKAVQFQLMLLGESRNDANMETLGIQVHPTAGMNIYTDANGTGTIKPLTLRSGNNLNQLVLNTNGRIGIGTASPSRELHVVGNFVSDGYWQVNATDTTLSGYIGDGLNMGGGNVEDLVVRAVNNLRLNVNNSSTSSMIINVSGNVGIGTASPNKNLEISQFNDATMRITSTQNDGSHVTTIPFGSFEVYSDDVSGGGAGVRGALRVYPSSPTGGSSELGLSTAGSLGEIEAIRINAQGKVGIGTVQPNNLLEISGTETYPLRIHRDSNVVTAGVFIEFSLHNSINNKSVYADVRGGIITNTSGSEDGSFIIRTKSSGTLADKMIIDNLGNVGFNSSLKAWLSSQTALQIGGTASINAPTAVGVSARFNMNQNAYNDGAWKYITGDEASNYNQVNGTHNFRVAPVGVADDPITWTTAMTIDNSGNFGFGNSSLKAWNPIRIALQIGGNTALSSSITEGVGTQFDLTQNAYFDPVGWKYIAGDEASRYIQLNGQHLFQVAPVGVADDPITWNTALTIDNDGNVGIGTAPSHPLHVSGNIKTTSRLLFNNDYFFESGTDAVAIKRASTSTIANFATGLITFTVPLQLPTGQANPTYSEGLVFYDDAKKALSYYNEESDTTINVGQEAVVRIFNNTGVTLTNGQAVRITGSSSGLPTPVLSIADTTINARCHGIVTHDIPNNETGYATIYGSVGGLNTSGYSEGDYLFIDPTTAGALTNVEPQITHIVAIVLVSDPTDGIILVKPNRVINITGIGQAVGAGKAQSITTTPTAITAYTNVAGLELNVSATFAGTDPYSADLSPDSAGASGYYRVTLSGSLTATDNGVVNFEIYINGSPTGIVSILDLTNNNVNSGVLSVNAISPSIISDTDLVEVYCYSDSGTIDVIYDSATFAIERIGNV